MTSARLESGIKGETLRSGRGSPLDEKKKKVVFPKLVRHPVSTDWLYFELYIVYDSHL